MQGQQQIITWPVEIKELARQLPGKVWGQVKEPSFLSDCPNCGGIGMMAAFVIADSAPKGSNLVLHVVEERTRLGYFQRAFCPVCKGDARSACGST